MESKKIYFLLIVLVIIIFSGCVISVVVSDRKAPEITLGEAGMVDQYSDDMDTSELLAGVTAYDDRDGDVTDSVTVLNVLVLDNGEYIKVTYAAKDSHNNVAQKSTKIKYSGSKSFINVSVTEDDSEVQTQETTTEKETVPQETTTAGPDLTQPGGSGTPVKIDQEKVKTTGVPQIELKYTDYVIKAGDSFGTAEALDMVNSTLDDKEGVSNRIVINGIGNVNTNRVGEYQLVYSVSDTDGNRSEAQTLTLHVIE